MCQIEHRALVLCPHSHTAITLCAANPGPDFTHENMDVSAGDAIVCDHLVLYYGAAETGVVAAAFHCPLRHISYNPHFRCGVCAELAGEDMADDDAAKQEQEPVSVRPHPQPLTAEVAQLERRADGMLPTMTTVTVTEMGEPEAPSEPLQPATVGMVNTWNTVHYDQDSIAEAGRRAGIASDRVAPRASNRTSLIEPLETIPEVITPDVVTPTRSAEPDATIAAVASPNGMHPSGADASDATAQPASAEQRSVSEGVGDGRGSVLEDVGNRKDSQANDVDEGKRRAAEALKRLDRDLDHFGSSEELREASVEQSEDHMDDAIVVVRRKRRSGRWVWVEGGQGDD